MPVNILNPVCAPTITSRCLSASRVSAGFGNTWLQGDDTDLLAWMNAYDMSSIAWGTTVVANFTNYPSPTITSTPTLPLVTRGWSYYFSVVRNGFTGITPGLQGGDVDYVRTQIAISNLFCGGTGYMILGGHWFIGAHGGAGGPSYPVGCSSFTNPCNIIELPLIGVGNAADAVGMAFGLIGPANYSVLPNVAPNLTAWLPSADSYLMEGFSSTIDSHWNAALICDDAALDPFDGFP
jgi:hypothetical protein